MIAIYLFQPRCLRSSVTNHCPGLEGVQCPGRIVTFGQNRAGDIYVIGYDTGILFVIDFESGEWK